MARKLKQKPVEEKEKLLSLILTREQWIELKNWLGWILSSQQASTYRKHMEQHERVCVQKLYQILQLRTQTNRFEIEITESNWVMTQIPVTLLRVVSGGGKLAHFNSQMYGEICKVLNGSGKDSDQNGW